MNQHTQIAGAKRALRSKSEPGWKLFLVLFAVKPVVDLLWQIQIVSFAGTYINPPRLVAILLFPVLLVILVDTKKRKIAGRTLILLFLLINLGSMWINIVLENISAGYAFNILFRSFDAYLLYMVFALYWTDRTKVYQFFTVIWMSILLVNLISIGVYFTGNFNVSISGGLSRFAGLYNSAAGPAYNGVFAIMFAALVVEMSAKVRYLKPIKAEKFLFITTAITGIALIYLSITKSAMVMLAIFAVMWWGFYKRQFYILIPAAVAVLFAAFSEGSLFKQRFAAETAVFIDGDYGIDALSSMGTGRFAYWLTVLDEFYEFTPVQMMIGVGRSFGAHNQFLAFTMMFGFVGLFLFVSILVVFYLNIDRVYKYAKLPELMFAKSLLVIFIAIAMVGHPFLWSTTLWYLMIALSLMNVNYRRVDQNSIGRFGGAA